MENLNEVKKRLYKESPKAHNTGWRGSEDNKVQVYQTHLKGLDVSFEVPTSDMGDEKFEKTMPAQLLIRWITRFKEF
jgi:hypothetical protein